jgi:RNA polymerase primary sigma factor
MLCQKCGLQPATVHLESQVFRQKIEEHLCPLCAGARAPHSVSTTAFTSPGKLLYPVALYLAQVGRQRVLTPKEERALWKQIESTERRAFHLVFAAPAVARYAAVIASRLLNGRERFERVVVRQNLETRAAYLKTLPRIVKSIVRQEADLGRRWSKVAKARGATPRRKLRQAFHIRQKSLATNLRKLSFKLKIYEEFLVLLDPTKEEINLLCRDIAAERRFTAKGKRGGALSPLRLRLREIESVHRMSAADLLAFMDKVPVCIREAHLAKSSMVGAHLQHVIAVAKKFTGHGRSFLDLIQEGNVGLMRAVEYFDSRGPEKFVPFATRLIIQAVAESVVSRPGAA